MTKEDKLTKRIGERIKLCRDNKNMMTQTELRDKLGIAQNHISNLENGKRRPSYDLLMEICDEFGVTPNFFLLETIEPVNNERLRAFYLWASSLKEDELEDLLDFCDSVKVIMMKKDRREE